jgi:hypothetical protein
MFTDTFSDADIRAVVGTNMFSDTEIHAMAGPGLDLRGIPHLDEFDFPEDLLGTGASAGVILPGLGLPLLPAEDPVEEPYGGGFAGPLKANLLLELERMAPEVRTTTIDELRKMDARDLERTNNKARNHFLLHSVGLADAEKETLWGGTVAPQKRKAGEVKGGKKKKAKKQVEVEESEKSRGNSESDHEEGEEEELEAPRKKRGGGRKSKKSGEGASEVSGAWAEKARRFLENKPYGESWQKLVRLWWTREEAAGFAGTVSTVLSPWTASLMT